MTTFLTVLLVLLVLFNMMLCTILMAIATDRNTAITEQFILWVRGRHERRARQWWRG